MARNDDIMAAIDAGESLASIATRFGISRNRVDQIRATAARNAETRAKWYGDLPTKVVHSIWPPLSAKTGRTLDELSEAEAITMICAIPRSEWERAPRLGKAGLRQLEAWLHARGRMLRPSDPITTL